MKRKRPDLPGPALEYMESEGYADLYPPQAACIRAGLLDGASLLVSAPTASGKTLIAILAAISHLSRNKGKVVYLSPLRALAAEKFAEFRKLDKLNLGRNIKISISTGDFDGIGRALARSDILVLTNEKMDSIMRHRVDWVEEIGLVIADEVHLIGDETRGPTLEMTLTQLKLLDHAPQILGLSATVTNSAEIADWLGCKLVKSSWRPVPLAEGVTDGKNVRMSDGTEFEFKPSVRGAPVDLGIQSVSEGGQSLLFAETRTRSKSLATKAADAVSTLLSKTEAKSLQKMSQKILAGNEQTEMVKTLAMLINKGVAFHHAGLNQNCRQVIEKGFKKGDIKLISSTPTLAAGVNLPARRVVISSISRYDARLGRNAPISVLEYKQLCGRAGRPQFDDHGQAIIASKADPYELTSHYIEGTPEPIQSRITTDRSLRTHLLSLIVTHPGIKKDGLLDFFLRTFGGGQTSKASLKFAIDVALSGLTRHGMLAEKSDRYAATELGQKTATLYIDPATAIFFSEAISGIEKAADHTLGYLYIITTCEEFFPRMALRSSDYNIAARMIARHRDELTSPIHEYDCTRGLLALHYWTMEYPEVRLAGELNIESGDLHRLVETADRLAYCLREIARHTGRQDLAEELAVLRGRIAYGIRPELLDLVRVKGVGRVRARALYKSRIRTVGDLAKTPVERLARIGKIGPTIADKIKSELRRIRH